MKTKTDKLIRTLVADPAWPFNDKLPGPARGAAKNYEVSTVDEIRRFLEDPANAFEKDLSSSCNPIWHMLADDCRLFLWRVSAMQAEALSVMKAWGFGEPKSEVVWRKLTKTGKAHFGMGRTVRLGHEVCLIGARGRPEVLSRSVRSVFDTEELDELDEKGIEPLLVEAPWAGHSVKPDVFFELVEELSPGPYLELFARKVRPGWLQGGRELGVVIPDKRLIRRHRNADGIWVETFLDAGGTVFEQKGVTA